MEIKCEDRDIAQLQKTVRQSYDNRIAAGLPVKGWPTFAYMMDDRMLLVNNMFPMESVLKIPDMEVRDGDLLIATFPRLGEFPVICITVVVQARNWGGGVGGGFTGFERTPPN